jgi:HlyD family secretion protein
MHQSNEAKSIDQIAKINDQIEKSKITNLIKGTVLAKYAEPNEITAFSHFIKLPIFLKMTAYMLAKPSCLK